MRRQMTPTLVLALSLLISLISFPSTAEAQQGGKRFAAETGVVTLGPNQVLRMSVTGDGKLLGNLLTVRFRRIEYRRDACNTDGVCKLAVASQTTSDPITLMPGEAAVSNLSVTTSDIDAQVRGVVLSNSPNVRVTAQVINTFTGEVVTQIIMANTEGDFH